MIRQIIISPSVRKTIKKLPSEIRKKLYWCIDILIKNKTYPSLRHKKIAGTDIYWEFSITMNYRVVYRRESDMAFIVAVGKHEDIF
ncbi:MAG: type II toxin-antitoxin system RelE/ParE family toxin [Elusimicrobiota bacterium]